MHVMLHMPQWFRSVMRSMHGPPDVQTVRPALHWQARFTQSSVGPSQVLLHEPQRSGLAVMSSQPLAQSSVPNGHSQVPPAHSLPPVQGVVQSPQCCASERVLKQPSGQSS